jgi:PAS domain S-box-containing protein
LAEEKRRGEAAVRALVETSPCMIVLLRFDRTIAYFSRFAADSTGRAVDEVLGGDFCALFLTEEDRPAMEEQIRQLRAGEPVRESEWRIRCRDDALRSFVWNADRLDDYEGAPAMLITALDITARKRAEERALQAQRLAAIGEAMTALIHESRNALQRSTACLEMLSLEVEDRPEAINLVQRTLRAQSELQRLYEEVRQYAAPLRLHREPTDLRALVRETWHNLAASREGKELKLVDASTGFDATCDVDRFSVGQVWRNILENAVQASPDGGTVTVRCAETTLDERSAVRISFLDEGPGLAADQKKRIFEPFFTTKAKGTGLGMAIAQRIVDAHGGQIDAGARSAPGAEILVTLPRHES